ncbi:rCG22330, partial [Rattus norvegicus]
MGSGALFWPAGRILSHSKQIFKKRNQKKDKKKILKAPFLYFGFIFVYYHKKKILVLPTSKNFWNQLLNIALSG